MVIIEIGYLQGRCIHFNSPGTPNIPQRTRLIEMKLWLMGFSMNYVLTTHSQLF